MSEEPIGLSKTALAKQQQIRRIAAVNNWRGQCLDNFVRVEHAIVRCSEIIAQNTAFKLEEAARNRTRVLKEALEANWPKQPPAIQLAALLDHWSIREKERNQLVHGRFTVKPAVDSEWLLINELLLVKKGMAISDRVTMDCRQAEAFLKAISAERKRLEEALDQLPEKLGLQT